MKKRMATLIFSVMIMSGMALNAVAAPQPSSMVISHPETGVTEGSREEKCVIIDGVFYPVNGSKGAFVEYVGIGTDDIGPWEHGVTTAGIVYSNYKNLKYWHGSSALGSGGLVRSELVQKNMMSSARVSTVWVDGNHSYWRVDENKQ